MYLLDFLTGFKHNKGDSILYEYRLLCSGELYNSTVQTADWRKSDATRVLLESPFLLFICSRPFNDYPQELALRFEAPMVTEIQGNSTSRFYPDDEIARDLASVLSLILRRNISVAGKVRETHPQYHEKEPEYLRDWPIDFINTQQSQFWPRKPSGVIYRPDGLAEIEDYNPPPLGIDPKSLKHTLTTLGGSKLAESLIFSARLYWLAFQHIHRDVGLAYQLLVSSIEATAATSLRHYLPPRIEMINTKKKVLELALRMGLERVEAEKLALEAAADLGWSAKKFVKFIVDHVGDEIWSQDDLFHPPEIILPNPDSFEQSLRLIYRARSGASHRGKSFPSSALVGLGPTIPSKAVMDLIPSKSAFPPVVWFERIVSSALNGFITKMGVGDDA